VGLRNSLELLLVLGFEMDLCGVSSFALSFALIFSRQYHENVTLSRLGEGVSLKRTCKR
jgi:hypothetical protein